MPHILDEVKQLLSKDKEEEAAQTLLALLKNGDLKMYHHLQELLPAMTKPTEKEGEEEKPKFSLKDFIAEVEQDHTDLLTFLKEYQAGRKAFSRQKWSKAKEAFTAALSVYQDSFAIKKEFLQEQIKLCKNGLQMKVHLQAGAQAFKEGKWDEAIKAYNLALKLYQKGFPFPKEKITGSIRACEDGKQYEMLIGKARHWMTLENWVEARNSFLEAQKLFRRGLLPDMSTVDYEIELCNEALKEDASGMSLSLWGELRNMPALILGTIGGVLIFTIIGVYMLDFKNFSTPSYSKSDKDSIETNSIMIPEQLTDEIDSLQTLDNSKAQVKDDLSTRSISIAILPFCESDPIMRVVAENLFKEAYDYIQRAKVDAKVIEQAAVLSHVRRARLNPDQICQNKNAKRIAKSIESTYLLIGDISQNEEGNIEVKYDVYSSQEDSLQFVFSLNGENVQEVKDKLKKAIDAYMRTF